MADGLGENYTQKMKFVLEGEQVLNVVNNALQTLNNKFIGLEASSAKVISWSRKWDDALKREVLVVKSLTNNGRELVTVHNLQANGWRLQTELTKIASNEGKKNAQIVRDQAKATRELAKEEAAKARASSRSIFSAPQQNAQGTGVKGTKTAFDDLFITMQSLERVVTFFMIRRAMFEFLTLTTQSIEKVKELHTAIAEIRTISQSSQSTFANWEASVVRTSNKWGFDLIDMARARYEILSNQMGQGAEQTEKFTDAVAGFAKVTHSTVEQGVDLLTGAINAYGLKAEDVTRVSAVLFKMIDLGRVKASEVANQFGTVAVLANQMGVSIEETAAMIATMTVKGVTAANAMTMIRGIFMGLAKPSRDLAKLFKELGVASGEQMIKVYGLAGSLKILYERTKGSTTEIAELFRNVRPAMGMQSLMQNLDGFNQTLAKFGELADKQYAVAIKDQFKSAGEQLQIIQTQFKNMFTTDFGQSFVKVIVDLSKSFDTTKIAIDGSRESVAGLVNLTKNLGHWAITATVAFIGLKAAISGLNAARAVMTVPQPKPEFFVGPAMASGRFVTNSFGQSMAGLGKALAPTIGFLALTTFIDLLIRAKEEANATKEAVNNFYEQIKQDKQKKMDAYDISLSGDYGNASQGLMRGYSNYIGGLNTRILEYQKTVKDVTKANKTVYADLNAAVQDYAQAINRTIDEIDEQIKKFQKVMEDADSSLQDFRTKDEERLRRVAQKGMNDEERLKYIQSEIPKILDKIRNYDGLDVRYADKLVEQLRDAQEEEQELRAKTREKNAKEDDKSDEKLKVLKQRKEDELNAYKKREAFKMAQHEAAEAERKANMKDKSKYKYTEYKPGMRPDQTVLDRQIKETEAKVAEASSKVQEKLQVAELQAAMKATAGDIEQMYANIAGYAEMEMWYAEQERSEILTNAMKQAATIFDSEFNKKFLDSIQKNFKAQVPSMAGQTAEEFVNKLIATTKVTDLSNLYIKNKDIIDSSNQAITTMKTQVQELTEMLNALAAFQAKNQQTIKDALDAQSANKQGITEDVSKISNLANQRGRSLSWLGSLGNFDNANRRANPDIRQIDSYHQKIMKLADELKEKDALKGLDTNDVAKVLAMQKLIDEAIKTANSKRWDPKINKEETPERIEQRNKAIDQQIDYLNQTKISTQNLLEKLKQQNSITNQITSAETNLKKVTQDAKVMTLDFANSGVRAFSNYTNSIWDAIDALSVLNAMMPGTGKVGPYKASGGMIYAARGMFVPRGTDTVPAMLTPGEFVMNRESTRKNLGRLVPMNYGQQNLPSNNSSVSFGDINVNVSGGSNTKMTAKSIAKELKNQLRHGMKL